MSLIDTAVTTRVFRRGDRFHVPLAFFQTAAEEFNGVFVERDEWQQIVFLCSDSVYFGFWTKKADGALEHQIVGMDLAHIHCIPGLYALWTQKNIGRTWKLLTEEFSGTPTREEPKGIPSGTSPKNSRTN